MSAPTTEHYWEGYRAAAMDLRVALAAWTQTADVESLMELLDKRLKTLSKGDDDIPFSDEPSFRATDPLGGRGKDAGFPVAASYTAAPFEGQVHVVKDGLVGDHFDPDQAEGFGELLKRCAARARLEVEV